MGVTYGRADLGIGDMKEKESSSPPAPPHTRRAGAGVMGRRLHGDSTTAEPECPRPSLPPRRPTATMTDLLGGDNGGGMGGWEALKPS